MVKHVRSGARAVGLFLLALLLVAAAQAGGQDKPDGPATQYQALLKEYQDQSADFRKAKTDEERKKAVEDLDRFALRFLELVEKSPRDPIAIEISIQVVRVVNAVDSLTQTSWEMGSTVFPGKGQGDPGGGMVTLLLREHLRSDKLGLVCERMRYGIRKEFETFLREVLKSNPHRDVQGLACLALAQFTPLERWCCSTSGKSSDSPDGPTGPTSGRSSRT